MKFLNSLCNFKLKEIKERVEYMNRLDQVIDLLINELPDIEEYFYDINCGGCGVMAALIADQLDTLKINYTIACKAWYCDDVSEDEVNLLIDNNDSANMPNSHLLVKINGRYFDSEGEQFPREEGIKALINKNTLNRMLAVDCWNDQFDRSQIEDMREFTNAVFNKVFKGDMK